MPRIRTIKPSFGQDEDLSDLPPETHLLAATLLTYADDEGYFKANPKLVKAQCCPLREDSATVEESLRQLHETGYIRLFTGTDEKRYGKVRKFSDHQKVNKPYASKIKELEPLQEHSGNVQGIVTECSPPEGKGKEKEKDSRRGASAPAESNKDYVWRVGVDLLTSAGSNERAARSFLGKLCRDHGDDTVREAVGRAVAIAPAEPKAWLQGAVKSQDNEPFMGDT